MSRPSADETTITAQRPLWDEEGVERFLDRMAKFGPPVQHKIYCLMKFALVAYLAFSSHPWSQTEVAFLVGFLIYETIQLAAAATEDTCLLICATVLSCISLTIYIILLIFVPIFVASLFGSGVGDRMGIRTEPTILSRFRKMYVSKEELYFFKAFEYGMSFELLLIFLIVVNVLQLSLIKGTLAAKQRVLKKRTVNCDQHYDVLTV